MTTDAPPDRRTRAHPTAALPDELLLRMHSIMLEARVLEERLIRMHKQGDGFFWIGGPGEEAFNTALGLLVNKGRGLDHDFLHLHYRSSAHAARDGRRLRSTALRQMAQRGDRSRTAAGRNFAGHYSVRAWNMCPVSSSPIEVQFSIAIGTACAQRRHGGEGITVVQGGDAGTRRGRLRHRASCGASRPGASCPLLIVVTNNRVGHLDGVRRRSTARSTSSDRGKPFGIEDGRLSTATTPMPRVAR